MADPVLPSVNTTNPPGPPGPTTTTPPVARRTQQVAQRKLGEIVVIQDPSGVTKGLAARKVVHHTQTLGSKLKAAAKIAAALAFAGLPLLSPLFRRGVKETWGGEHKVTYDPDVTPAEQHSAKEADRTYHALPDLNNRPTYDCRKQADRTSFVRERYNDPQHRGEFTLIHGHGMFWADRATGRFLFIPEGAHGGHDFESARSFECRDTYTGELVTDLERLKRTAYQFCVGASDLTAAIKEAKKKHFEFLLKDARVDFTLSNMLKKYAAIAGTAAANALIDPRLALIEDQLNAEQVPSSEEQSALKDEKNRLTLLKNTFPTDALGELASLQTQLQAMPEDADATQRTKLTQDIDKKNAELRSVINGLCCNWEVDDETQVPVLRESVDIPQDLQPNALDALKGQACRELQNYIELRQKELLSTPATAKAAVLRDIQQVEAIKNTLIPSGTHTSINDTNTLKVKSAHAYVACTDLMNSSEGTDAEYWKRQRELLTPDNILATTTYQPQLVHLQANLEAARREVENHPQIPTPSETQQDAIIAAQNSLTRGQAAMEAWTLPTLPQAGPLPSSHAHYFNLLRLEFPKQEITQLEKGLTTDLADCTAQLTRAATDEEKTRITTEIERRKTICKEAVAECQVQLHEDQGKMRTVKRQMEALEKYEQACKAIREETLGSPKQKEAQLEAGYQLSVLVPSDAAIGTLKGRAEVRADLQHAIDDYKPSQTIIDPATKTLRVANVGLKFDEASGVFRYAEDLNNNAVGITVKMPEDFWKKVTDSYKENIGKEFQVAPTKGKAESSSILPTRALDESP